MSFTHLHVHSEYSLLDGLIKIPDLVAAVKAQGGTAVALTDHGAMHGAFQFYLECLDQGIKPIIGLEAYKAAGSRHDRPEHSKRDHFHLTILAKNYIGYKNLIALTSASHLEGFHYKPRLDFELLEQYHEGIIVLSGCGSSEISMAIKDNQHNKAEELVKKYSSIFGDDFYIEIQRSAITSDEANLNTELVKLSRKFAVPIVATNDVHYLTSDQAYAQEILLCIQTQRTILEKNRGMSMFDVPEFYLKTEAEMKGLFIDIPEAIENTKRIADSVDLTIPYGNWILPKFVTPDKSTSSDYLRSLTYLKAKERLAVTDEVKKRIDYELSVIDRKGYSTYFLVVQDFVNWAKAQAIAVGPGRGSAAGSLVAYCLNITDINPLAYNLPFERFLNPDRPTPPDFDIDFADARRDEVLEYVTKKYGEDNVAQIITFGRMEARLAVRDVTRALGLSYSHGDRIAKMIPIGRQGFAMTIDRALQENPALKFAYDHEEDVKRVLTIAAQVEGIARHSSVHAAGVVLSDKNLTEYVPLQKETKGDKIITQYDMYSLDLNAVSGARAVGLLKMDFLGLRNLTIIEQALKFVRQTKGIEIDIHNVPLDDKGTYELIAAGKTIGVFQLESRGMRQLAIDLKPTKLSDIAAMVALYRPGPMDLIPSFLGGKKNIKSIKYLHADLKPILGETYGVLVYQEQVMEIANQIAGFTMSEADNLRMAMGKKKKSLMQKEKEKFLKKTQERGYTKALSEKIFGFIEKFVGYGFNKPHSASYGLIAYWTGYMKANYPVEYMTALLSAELQGSAGSAREVKVFAALEECRAMKIAVQPPDINKSSEDFSIENGGIRFGLSAVKNVGRAAIESILEVRSKKGFTGFKEFLTQVDLRRVNKKTIESLIKSGAFDQFGTRAALLVYYSQIHEEVQKGKLDLAAGQVGLFADSSSSIIIDDIPDTPEFDEDEIVVIEKEVFGFSLSSSPLAKYKSAIESKISIKIGEIGSADIGKIHIIGGSISKVKFITTKKNNSRMAFATIYDETGSIELVIFPNLFKETISLWQESTPVLLKGRIDEKGAAVAVIVDRAVDLSKVAQAN